MSWGNQIVWPNPPQSLNVDGKEIKSNETMFWPKSEWSEIKNPPEIVKAIELELIQMELYVPCEVQGKKIGDLMVYEWKGYWYVAHIPTETRFDSAVPDGEWTEEQLIKWCKKVQEINKPLFEILATATYETYSSVEFDEARDTLKEFCLNMSVE